jgi:hypothetical protein
MYIQYVTEVIQNAVGICKQDHPSHALLYYFWAGNPS